MFEGAAIDRQVELSDEVGSQRHAYVLNDRRALILRNVDTCYACEPHCLAQHLVGKVSPAISVQPGERPSIIGELLS